MLENAPAMVSIYTYPDGTMSGCATMRRGSWQNRPKPQVEESADSATLWDALPQVVKDAENQARTRRRASTELRRKVRYGDLRRLLTFTNGDCNGEGWDTHRQALRDFAEWYYKAGGRELLGDSAMVSIAERGTERRRVHLHAAIRAGYNLPYRAIHASWSAYLESKGFHSQNGNHRWHAGDDYGDHADGFTSARVCGNYLAKYLSKGFETDARTQCEKRYRSEGCLVPPPTRLMGMLLGEVPTILDDTFGDRGIKTKWFESPNGDYGGYWFEVEATEARA